MKKTTPKNWEKELRNMYKQELKNDELDMEQLLEWYPNKQEMIDQDNWMKEHQRNKDIFLELRANSKDEDEFELFKAKAIKDNSLLKGKVKDELIPSFVEFLKIRRDRSSGMKKLSNYFTDLLKRDNFQNKIKAIKDKYKIPYEGLPYEGDKSDQMVDAFLDMENVEQEIDNLATSFGLYDYSWHSFFGTYILFNRSSFKDYPYYALNFDLCHLEEYPNNELDEFTENSTEEEQNYEQERKIRKNKEFPVAIRISPYASERDIIDFIKKNFSEIEAHQSMYRSDKIKIGKVKKKKSSIQERNDFIYANRNLPRKKIMMMVTDKFKETLDYGHIGKIISLETKKRKEV